MARRQLRDTDWTVGGLPHPSGDVPARVCGESWRDAVSGPVVAKHNRPAGRVHHPAESESETPFQANMP
jgi:hypothetical protein